MKLLSVPNVDAKTVAYYVIRNSLEESDLTLVYEAKTNSFEIQEPIASKIRELSKSLFQLKLV